MCAGCVARKTMLSLHGGRSVGFRSFYKNMVARFAQKKQRRCSGCLWLCTDRAPSPTKGTRAVPPVDKSLFLYGNTLPHESGADYHFSVGCI